MSTNGNVRFERFEGMILLTPRNEAGKFCLMALTGGHIRRGAAFVIQRREAAEVVTGMARAGFEIVAS
jgi:hypothetical protein